MQSFWEIFWLVVFIASIVIFAGVTIVVAVGGFRDVLAMFRRIDEQHEQNADKGDEI